MEDEEREFPVSFIHARTEHPLLRRMSYLPSPTTSAKLNERINGEIPPHGFPGEWTEFGALNRNKQEILD
jgi:hypothetical protein